MNDIILKPKKGKEDVLAEKLISCENYCSNKEVFLDTLKHIYERSSFLDLSYGMNVEDFIEEVVTHNFNVCYEMALMYEEEDGVTSEVLSNAAEQIYNELFDCRLTDALFACILQSMNELKYSFNITLNMGEVMIFGSCQNVLLPKFTNETAHILHDLGYAMFSLNNITIMQKGGAVWGNYQQHLIGS